GGAAGALVRRVVLQRGRARPTAAVSPDVDGVGHGRCPVEALPDLVRRGIGKPAGVRPAVATNVLDDHDDLALVPPRARIDVRPEVVRDNAGPASNVEEPIEA